jgi:hypothetical protein
MMINDYILSRLFNRGDVQGIIIYPTDLTTTPPPTQLTLNGEESMTHEKTPFSLLDPSSSLHNITITPPSPSSTSLTAHRLSKDTA